MYKDKKKQQEAVRKAVAKHRKGITSEGITEQGITSEGVTETWYPNKPTDGQGRPIKPVILSDGQLWYPDPRSVFVKPVKENQGKVLHFDNGTYIHIHKLVDTKWRKLLTYLTENLKPSFQDSIRAGMAGPSIRECQKLLEVTG